MADVDPEVERLDEIERLGGVLDDEARKWGFSSWRQMSSAYVIEAILADLRERYVLVPRLTGPAIETHCEALSRTCGPTRRTPPRCSGASSSIVDAEREASVRFWTWIGPKIKRTGHGTWGKVLAHRHSWALANGPIPDGMWVLHHCDNPPCVNPRHLYLGTVVENVRDAITRGRFYVPPRKTHCAQGHALEGDNLRIVNTKQGERRVCRTCDNTRSRELQRKRRGSDRLSQSKD